MAPLTPVRTLSIQSPDKFKQTTKLFNEVCEFPHYKVTDGVVSSEAKYTRGGNTCSILAMSNGKDTYIGHFAPEFYGGNFKDKLDYIVQKFKDKSGELTAMITGGFSRNAQKANLDEANRSFTQLAVIGDVLGRHTDDITMIAGKTNPVFVDNLAVDGEKFILSHTPKIGSKYTPELKKNPTSQEVEQALYDNYEIVDFDGTPEIEVVV